MTPPPPHDGHDAHENQRREDRGRDAREREPQSDGYDIRQFAKKTGFNINTIFALLILAGTGTGGYKAWSVGSSVDEAAKVHAEASAKHDAALASLAKVQGDVNAKVDVMVSKVETMTSQFVELRAAQVVLGKSQDDLRVEIASLKASGTETKVRDMDAILRKQGEEIAELKALIREKDKK